MAGYVTAIACGHNVPIALVSLYEKNKAASVVCWRLGELGGLTAVAPWLCVTVFRRLCSETAL